MEVYLPVMENNGTYVIFTAQNVDDPAELMRRYPSALPNKYYHHSTNRFGRQPFDDREGEPMRLRITGRLITDRVDALVVDNPNSDNEIPHITLATADGVKPFASNAELKAHYADIEPLDDYVDTTFRNNMSRSRKNESFLRPSMPLNEKKGGHNYAGRDDEFYTRPEDIKRELSNYDLSGKVVYCNCDVPSMSEFYKFFKNNYDSLRLSGLVATYYSDTPCMYWFNGDSERKIPIKSGRFQDNERIMRMCDVVVTNPPFSDSMPHQLVNMARKMGKDVIIVGPLDMARRNDMFELVKSGKLNYGHSPINRYRRDGEKSRTAPTAWWTTFPVERGNYSTGKSYDPSRYRKYDNYDAIECPSYSDLPDDYDGKIGVPWRFLGKLDRRQYDVVDKIRPRLDGKNLDTRLIIQRKSVTESLVRRITEMIMRKLF